MTRDMAASVRGRLMNQSKQSKRPFQELLTYFAMERFLFRLSQSPHADRFVLKGALMFAVWGAPQSRATRDIDLLAHAENSVDSMTEMMRSVCEQSVAEDGIVFLPETVKGIVIKEDADYEGVRVTFVATIQNARIPMQIDIGFGDVIHPSATAIVYPGMLDFETAELSGYPRETVIAEKFEAMTQLGQLNSRMKDFYDILILSRQFDFDGENLCTAIEKTFGNRGTKIQTDPIGLSVAFSEDPSKQAQWSGFLRKSKLSMPSISLAEVAKELREFLLPITDAIVRGQRPVGQWRAPGPWSNK